MRFVPATRSAWRCAALASCISALAGIAPGGQAEAQTAGAATQPQAAVTGPMTLHYFEGRITLPQFRWLGLEYGRYRLVALYLCGSTWTTSSTCGSLYEGRARWSTDAIRSYRQD